ncbi:hypothetical protein [Falsirhodobacter sp. 20TX0035]|uniref:hypothetical protein n=1 Tax=Falsirhodobacter sp. 20TX0035 TaxID=3022019 RepID=UPI00232BE1C7|nr:hypothetical protein [Falsirhodobacter sp. 20TX0035]MDB6454363.1 hypothetical protein [Falsirhodobacter sp. 20TX0035]
MKAIRIMAVLALAGCSAEAARPPAPSLQDGNFVSVLQPAGLGHSITRKGVVPVQGMTMAIYNTVDPLGYDDGKLAKDVAARACANRMLRFDPTVVGKYQAPNWVFEGACR